MSIDACIAHAIHSDLDILEVLPELKEMPVEHLEPYIERYILDVQQVLRTAILDRGQNFLKANDAAGLCATCLEAGVNIPPKMLLKMCRTILQLTAIDARFILDTDEGASLFYMKVQVNVLTEEGRRAA
jgi:hypothetical protein